MKEIYHVTGVVKATGKTEIVSKPLIKEQAQELADLLNEDSKAFAANKHPRNYVKAFWKETHTMRDFKISLAGIL